MDALNMKSPAHKGFELWQPKTLSHTAFDKTGFKFPVVAGNCLPLQILAMAEL